MNQDSNFHDQLYSILKVMGFETFLRANKVRGFNFNRDMFVKPNQKAFEHVSIYLFKQLKYTECLNELKGSYPCMDKKQEADFRKILMKYLKKLESDPDFDHKFLPVLMHNPGGDQFALLFLCFANYVAKKVMLKGFSLTNLSVEDLKMKRIEQQALLEQTAKKFYDEKQQLLEGIAEFTNKVICLRNQVQTNQAELQQLNSKLMEKFNFYDLNQIKTHISKQVIQIQSVVKQFDGWMFDMERLLQNEFKNESMIIDASKLAPNVASIDLIERFDCIKGKLEIFKDILHKNYPEIEKRNRELLSKNTILTEIEEKLNNVNDQLNDLKGQLAQQYEQQKREYLARDDVAARIKRIAEMMNINFPKIVFEPVESVATSENTNLMNPSNELMVTSTIMKKKNRRVSMYDCEPSLIEMFDVSGYTFNPPSDSDLSFSPVNRPNPRRESRFSTIFDRY